MATSFPDGFLWGASTAAYQIEGAVTEDGRGPSIWDTFSHLPGKILSGDNGDIACDHYHRWPQDVALMSELGIGAYRLSTAWPRILPEGRGRPNEKGLEFYDRLIDAIMAADIEPWICLYHWDLPQALEDRGGWQNRDVASWFADYAHLTVRRLGDRVKHWATFNEPNAASIKGYCDGDHAPGIRGRMTALSAIHVMNIAHGLGVEAMRSERADLLVGNIYNFHPREPASEREQDQAAALMLDALWNRSFPDPQIHGHYPELLAADMESLVLPGDLDLIRHKLDYFAMKESRFAVISCGRFSTISSGRSATASDSDWSTWITAPLSVAPRTRSISMPNSPRAPHSRGNSRRRAVESPFLIIRAHAVPDRTRTCDPQFGKGWYFLTSPNVPHRRQAG